MRKAKRHWYVLAFASLLFSQTVLADTADFLGTWVNPKPRKAMWGQLVITQNSSGAVEVARFGACGFHGTELCDDGVHTLTLYPEISGEVKQGLSEGPSPTTGDVVFADRTLVFKLNLDTGVLTVITFTRFTDPDRGIYVVTDKLNQQP